MIMADTSAIMAILMEEPEGRDFEAFMYSDGEVLVSTATAVELLVVCLGRSNALYQDADEFLDRPCIQLVPLDVDQMRAAGSAYQRFGRGRDQAALNFGDTFSYALASTRGLPLLFKGDDFIQTDIVPAALPGS